MTKVLTTVERLVGRLVMLRLATLDDCTERYCAWLNDPLVNRYLETRWREQTLDSIREFVTAMLAAPDSYLFAIVQRATGDHVGNIKLGPVNPHHLHADVSYFIGDRRCWGQGLATDAIRVASGFGFSRLGLHRLQAGVYASNVGSARALEKAGYTREARFRDQLRGVDGWEDHVWYGALCDEWQVEPSETIP